MEPEDTQPVVTMQPEEAEPSVEAVAPLEGDEPGVVTDEPIRWTAKERIDTYRPPVWYLLFLVGVIALIAIAIFLLKSTTFAILVVVMAAALVVYTRRPPQEVTYLLSRKGLHVNDKLYGFGEFRGFGVVQAAGYNALTMLPVKRFRPAVEVYFPDEAGEAIVDMLAARLPMHDIKQDSLEKIARKLRF